MMNQMLYNIHIYIINISASQNWLINFICFCYSPSFK